jgi:thiamine pyrophosphate-dependent acetolactate synthase large subunit-like protein
MLGSPMVDYVGLARSQGVDGETVTKVQDLEPALRAGLRRVVEENRPYLLEVAVAREGVGADATWDHSWEL